MTEDEIREIAKINGQVRGTGFQTDARYIISRHGTTGLAKIEEKMKDLNYPIYYGQIKALGWLPFRSRLLSFLAMRDIFNWSSEDFTKMGDMAPKYSFIMRLFSKIMTSARATFNASPEFWKKYHDTGAFEPHELNEKDKYVILRITDFMAHSLYCKYLEGYLCRILMYLYPHAQIRVQETKCPQRGELFHEFHFTW